MIGFTIEGAPVPKGRPRFTRTGHTFTPAKTRQYEALVTARAISPTRSCTNWMRRASLGST